MLSLKSENTLIKNMFVENVNCHYEFQYYSKYNQLYSLQCIKDVDDQNKFTFTFPIKNKSYSYTTVIYGDDEAKEYIDNIIQNYICE
tara:strand:- start:475 stop:735 length:261 start_codon:yes stop_codon:yes gene_type:complete